MKAKWVKWSNLIVCPLCGAHTEVSNSSIICKNNHCFDISKKGYVNFVRSNSKKIYDESLFLNRKSIYECGFYNPVIEEVNKLVECYTREKEKLVVVDAGCGEGTYIDKLCGEKASVKIAFDISKEAIVLASKKDKSILWCVADLVSIPIKDNCVDVLFNILTPANYISFNRILKDSGIMVKIIPGNNYLIELRNILGQETKVTSYSEERVANHLAKHMRILDKRKILYKVSVDKGQALSWARMTPLMANVLLNEETVSRIKCITVDINIYVCRKGVADE